MNSSGKCFLWINLISLWTNVGQIFTTCLLISMRVIIISQAFLICDDLGHSSLLCSKLPHPIYIFFSNITHLSINRQASTLVGQFIFFYMILLEADFNRISEHGITKIISSRRSREHERISFYLRHIQTFNVLE